MSADSKRLTEAASDFAHAAGPQVDEAWVLEHVAAGDLQLAAFRAAPMAAIGLTYALGETANSIDAETWSAMGVIASVMPST